MKRNERKRSRKGYTRQPRGTFKVTEFKNPAGLAFRVLGMKLDGTRIRQNFKTSAEAENRRQQLQIEAENAQSVGRSILTTLTPEQVNEAQRAYAELKNRPLLPAIHFYLENYREPLKPRTVAQAFDEFLEAKRLDGFRVRTIRNLASRVGMLKKQFGAKLVSDILPQHIGDIVGRAGAHRSQLTKTNDRLALSSFFSWCMDSERGYCSVNPAKKTTKSPRTNGEAEPQIFTVDEVCKLMETASTFKDGRLVPYIALGVFAGIRPAELARLDWDCIDLETGSVTIGPKIAKMRSRRIIEMVCLSVVDNDGSQRKLAANLIEWLAPHALKRTPITGPNWRKDFDALRRAAGWRIGRKADAQQNSAQDQKKSWAEDIMRHTAISNYLAYNHDEGKAAEWAGNSPNVIHKHYRALVKRQADAEAFWNIRPAKQRSRKRVTLGIRPRKLVRSQEQTVAVKA